MKQLIKFKETSRGSKGAELPIRQRILSLAVGATEKFDIERYDYVQAATYRIGRSHRRKHKTSSTDDYIVVQRIA